MPANKEYNERTISLQASHPYETDTCQCALIF